MSDPVRVICPEHKSECAVSPLGANFRALHHNLSQRRASASSCMTTQTVVLWPEGQRLSFFTHWQGFTLALSFVSTSECFLSAFSPTMKQYTWFGSSDLLICLLMHQEIGFARLLTFRMFQSQVNLSNRHGWTSEGHRKPVVDRLMAAQLDFFFAFCSSSSDDYLRHSALSACSCGPNNVEFNLRAVWFGWEIVGCRFVVDRPSSWSRRPVLEPPEGYCLFRNKIKFGSLSFFTHQWCGRCRAVFSFVDFRLVRTFFAVKYLQCLTWLVKYRSRAKFNE